MKRAAGRSPVANPFEHRNKLSVSMKGREFPDQLN